MISLRHVGIVVSDLDRSLEFYCRHMGFTILRRMKESGSFVSAILGIPDAVLETVKIADPQGGQIELLAFSNPRPDLGPAPHLTRRGPTHVALTVTDLDDLYDKLRVAGINFTAPPRISDDGLAKVTFCQDPDGTWLELVELALKKT